MGYNTIQELHIKIDSGISRMYMMKDFSCCNASLEEMEGTEVALRIAWNSFVQNGFYPAAIVPLLEADSKMFEWKIAYSEKNKTLTEEDKRRMLASSRVLKALAKQVSQFI